MDNRYHLLGAGFVIISAIGLVGTPALAVDVNGAASIIAQGIVDGLKKATGSTPRLIMLAEFRAPEGDAARAEFAGAFAATLIKRYGVTLVDRESVSAAITETMSGLATNDTALTELAGAFGAEFVIVGSLDRSGADYIVNARAISAEDGTVAVTVKANFTPGGGDISDESATLQAQLRRLSDRLAAGLEGLSGELRYQRIAVLPFQEVGSNTQDKQLGILVSAELTTLLRRDHNLMLVERTQVAKIVEEMALGQLGMIGEGESAEVGRLAGAQGLVIGTVSEAGDRYLVNARVVGAETGQVVVAEEVSLPAADLVALSSEAVVLRTRTGAVYRSVLLPGWGQLYNRQPVKGAAFVGAEVLMLGGALAFHIRATQADERYNKMTSGNFDRVHDRQVSSRKWRNGLLWATLALHAVNVLDAVLSGKSFDSAEPVGGGPI